MKILLLGATGRTGKWVYQKSLEHGYSIHCLARNTERIEKHDQVSLFEGDASNPDDLATTIAGCNAVISVLNISRRSDFPWSALRTPKNYLSKTMGNLVPIAEKNKVNRIIICSAWGVSETAWDIPGWFKWLIQNSNIGVAYKDHERQENIISDSSLNWTIVRPTGLTPLPKEQRVLEILDNDSRPNLTISRRSLATFLVNCLERDDLMKKKVVISKA
jgi:putative NADH-flavin reductase